MKNKLKKIWCNLRNKCYYCGGHLQPWSAAQYDCEKCDRKFYTGL